MTSEEIVARGIDKKVDEILRNLRNHVSTVNLHHPLYNSTHEGLGFLVEEVREFMDEVHGNNTNRSMNEALDIAIVCVRYILSMKEKDALLSVGKKT